MAEFTGEKDMRVRIRRPLADVFAKFTDPDVRAKCMPDLDRFEKVDEGTYRWIMKEENEKGIRFRPDYTVKYESNGKDEFSWSTVRGNPTSRGRGKCRSISESETEVEYHEKITTDIPVPRLIAPVIKGIVSKKITSGVEYYVERVKAAIEKG